MNINKTEVEKLLDTKPGTVLRDSSITGFQARRISTGVAYHFEYRAGSGRSAPVRRISIGRHSDALTPTQARAIAKRHYTTVATGGDPALDRSKGKTIPTLAAYARDLLTKAREIALKHPENARLTIETIKGYESYLKVHVEPVLGRRRLDHITKREVQELHDKVSLRSPLTANRCLQFISSLYGSATKAEILDRGTNPTIGIEKNKENGKERFLEPGESIRLGDAIRTAETTGVPYSPRSKPGKNPKHIPKSRPPYIISHNAADAIRLLALIGCRSGALLPAKWSDINFALGTLNRFSKGRRRPILLPDAAIEILENMPRISSYIFPQDTNFAKPKSDIAKQWRAVRKLAGLEDLRLHDLRHNFASEAISGGASLPMVGALLGHTQSRTTERYAHLANAPLRKVLQQSSENISGKMGSRDRGGRDD